MLDNDAIGLALLDYYKDNYTVDIVVKSSIAEDDIIPLPYLFRTKKQLPKIEKKALDLCYGNVLDVGAGSGCHSLILQEKGLTVKAIDTSKGAVEVMKLQEINAAEIDFYVVTDQFDTLLFLMNGVGIAGTLDELPKFLKKAKSLLKDKGQILLDSSDIAYMFKEEDGSTWVDLNSTYYGEVTYQMEYKNYSSPKFNWLFIDFKRLKETAIACGLKCELVCKGSHYDYLAKLTLE